MQHCQDVTTDRDKQPPVNMVINPPLSYVCILRHSQQIRSRHAQ